MDDPGTDDVSRKFQRDLNAGLVALVLLGVLAETDEDLRLRHRQAPAARP